MRWSDAEFGLPAVEVRNIKVKHDREPTEIAGLDSCYRYRVYCAGKCKSPKICRGAVGTNASSKADAEIIIN